MKDSDDTIKLEHEFQVCWTTRVGSYFWLSNFVISNVIKLHVPCNLLFFLNVFMKNIKDIAPCKKE